MIKVSKKDLFELEDTHHLALCVSKDFKMNAGIARKFQMRYKLREALLKYEKSNTINVGDTIKIGKFLILVTKETYNDKPTYDSMEKCLTSMTNIIVESDIKKLGTYRLGCGLDNLDWSVVRYMLEKSIGKTDISIEIRDYKR